MIPTKQFIDGMHEHQIDVFRAFDTRLARFYVQEWARRHRKTTLAVNLLIRESCRIPQVRHVYVAPTQVMARDIVWDDPTMLASALPSKAEMDWKRNEQKMSVRFANGSLLKFGGSDEPDSIRGIDALGVGFDEWALIKENTWTEIFRPIIAGPTRNKSLVRWAMFLYTPKGINHASLMFDRACCLGDGGVLPEAGAAQKLRPGWFASRLDGELAGIMTPEELRLAKEDMPQAMYDQEIRCSRITEEERTLITSKMLNDLHGVDWVIMRKTIPEVRKIVAIDPAFGGDMCVIKGFVNTRIVESVKIHPHMTNEIILEAKRVASEIDTKNFIVDCIGNGKGVADGLASDVADYYVQYFNSSHKAVEGKQNAVCLFANKKAEAWFYVSELIRKIRTEAIHDRELVRQLPLAGMYKVAGSGKMIMQPKDKIKELLGCSPDDADCYVYGQWGLQFVDPVSERKSDYGNEQEDSELMMQVL